LYPPVTKNSLTRTDSGISIGILKNIWDMLSELEHLVVNLKSYVKDENRKHVSHSINIMWVSLSNPSFEPYIHKSKTMEWSKEKGKKINNFYKIPQKSKF
jgi:hypothetical protein